MTNFKHFLKTKMAEMDISTSENRESSRARLTYAEFAAELNAKVDNPLVVLNAKKIGYWLRGDNLPQSGVQKLIIEALGND